MKTYQYFVANAWHDPDGENYFEKVLAPFFKELGLSEAAQYSLTTDDAASQPYTGWGMFFVRDDIFKLSFISFETSPKNSQALVKSSNFPLLNNWCIS